MHQGTGGIGIDVQGGTVTISGGSARGIVGQHLSNGDIDIRVADGTVETSGLSSVGVYGHHRSTGGIGIEVQGSTITTSEELGNGVVGYHLGNGDIDIRIADGTIGTSGSSAYGIHGLHQGTGDIGIRVASSTIGTSGSSAHGVYGLHQGGGRVDVQIPRGVAVRAEGAGAHGIAVGGLDAEGIVQGSVGRDAEGYRRQTVTVNGQVRGGSGDAAGISLAGGGRVEIGAHGSVGADSGIAIQAVGRESDSGTPGSRLYVNLALNDRLPQRALDGRIVNDDEDTTLLVNEVLLVDGTAGVTGLWAPNGVWDVTARETEAGGLELVRGYAQRTTLYESLPELLLRLDAGAPVQHPKEAVWAQLEYGAGRGEARRSQTGTSYDFDRIEARVGTSRAWGDYGGSVWLRRVQSEVRVDSSEGSGELELHGVGAGVAAHWHRVDGLEVSGELARTDFDVDADSARHGRLARDVGAELWQARLAAGFRLEPAHGLRLTPRAWAWHAEADLNDFTDAVGARVRYADESRTAAGLGLRAELAQSESLLYGSLDLERVLGGEATVVEVSGQGLASESEKTRVWVGVGGRLRQGEWVTLRGGLRLGDPGGRNQEVSASVSVGGHF